MFLAIVVHKVHSEEFFCLSGCSPLNVVSGIFPLGKKLDLVIVHKKA